MTMRPKRVASTISQHQQLSTVSSKGYIFIASALLEVLLSYHYGETRRVQDSIGDDGNAASNIRKPVIYHASLWQRRISKRTN